METIKSYDNYPVWIAALSNLLSLLIYGCGFIIMLRTGWIVASLYLIFILTLEFRLLSRHCVDCYYWGKTCGFGKGRISSWLFKKGDSSKFCNNKMTWKDMIPDLLVSLIPLVTAIVLMIIKFDFVILFSVVLLVILSTTGNGFIRGKLTCRFCKQRESGCPADKLFNKDK
jgi:hypothetical protein